MHWLLLLLLHIFSNFADFVPCGKLLNDNLKTLLHKDYPIYDKPTQILILYKAAKGEIATCSRTPYKCQHSSTFVIDLSKLDHSGDVVCDGLSQWKNNSTYPAYFCLENDSMSKANKENFQYKLVITYYQHKIHTSCKKG
ncbi:hypothetical protein EB796_009569 [Bugula neritina]|uniref:Uncharacterized protein n=1 Tax=Bugula neritina TaxID=10212 RepID=A0A7J7K3G3_BUGNE|nr:hypothetical protein EB796_009569 [Bugula neritina]